MPRDGSLQCSDCRAALSLDEILGDAKLAPAGWVHFLCPRCNSQSYVHFEESRIAVGFLDGVPGPAFIETSVISVASLHVTERQNEVRIEADGQRWIVRAAMQPDFT